MPEIAASPFAQLFFKDILDEHNSMPFEVFVEELARFDQYVPCRSGPVALHPCTPAPAHVCDSSDGNAPSPTPPPFPAALRSRPVDERLDALFDVLDVDGDGALDVNDMADLLTLLLTRETPERIGTSGREAWKLVAVLPAEGRHFYIILDCLLLRTITLTSGGPPLSSPPSLPPFPHYVDAVAEAMVSALDVANQGAILKETFVDYMASIPGVESVVVIDFDLGAMALALET